MDNSDWLIQNKDDPKVDKYRYEIQKHLDNGWIPNEDVLRYAGYPNNDRQKMDTNEQRDDVTSESEKFSPYKPALDRFPLNLLQNLTTPISPSDVIFQWHIPKAAGTSTKTILTNCFHLARAEQREYPQSFAFMNNNVMNLDTSSIAGIARAIEDNLVEQDLLDVITSSYVHEGCAILNENHKGRLFAIMRHPVEIAESMFYYLGKATWERTYNEELKNMTLLEYATSEKEGLRIDNWMTRYLARKVRGDLTKEDVQLAKDILEYKCLIGLTDEYVESMKRLDVYLGLNVWSEPPLGLKCIDAFMSRKAINKNEHKKLARESKEWKILSKVNAIDVEIYEFARDLFFNRQKDLLENRSSGNNWNFRRKEKDWIT